MNYITGKIENEQMRKCKILVSGEAGTGKSYCLINTVRLCTEHDLVTKVCCPTGLMSNYYKQMFQGEIDCETVSFSYM